VLPLFVYGKCGMWYTEVSTIGRSHMSLLGKIFGQPCLASADVANGDCK